MQEEYGYVRVSSTDQNKDRQMLEMKKQNNALHLICAVSHPGFENQRGFFEARRYNHILKNADYVTTISDHYYKACHQKRNE